MADPVDGFGSDEMGGVALERSDRNGVADKVVGIAVVGQAVVLGGKPMIEAVVVGLRSGDVELAVEVPLAGEGGVVAGVMILPQAIVLGATFPLMAAGLVRRAPSLPGGGVATAYFLNTIGGAAGVVLSGFLLIGTFGLPAPPSRPPC